MSNEIDYYEFYGVERPKGREDAADAGGDGGDKPSQSASLTAPPEGEPRPLRGGRAARSEVGANGGGSDGGPSQSPPAAEPALPGGEPRPLRGGAEDAGEDSDDGEFEGAPDAQAQEAGQGGKKPQSREENARFAAARRKQERDAAVQKAREEERRRSEQDMDALIAGMGLEDPYTGKKITTKAEYEQYQARHREKQHENRLKNMHMSQQEYDEMIAGLPEVQEAKRVREEAQKAEWDRRIRAEIAQVTAMNPAIQGPDDLVKDEKFEQIQGYLSRGMTIPEAYQLAHINDLSEGRARQQAVNLAGKSHLSATHSRGQSGPEVPEDVLRSFREFDPTATREEVAAYYNRHGRR